jgi:hypothetical protein
MIVLAADHIQCVDDKKQKDTRGSSMKIRLIVVSLMALMLTGPAQVSATSVKHMNIDELAAKADKIFRGTVISIKPGTVQAGGAELNTVTYTLRVEDSFKGDYLIAKNDVRLAKITMITDAKSASSANGLQKAGFFRDVPQLAVGGVYLLFTSAESRIGLSTTVGLGQGCFDISGSNALNRAGNIGLFQGSALQGPTKGALPYEDIAQKIRDILATQ